LRFLSESLDDNMRVIGKTYGKQRTQRSTSAPHNMKKRVDKIATE